MGLNDAQEMLDAAKADAILMERQIADLQDRLDSIRALTADPMSLADPEDAHYFVVEVDELLTVLDRPTSNAQGVFLRDHDAHEIAAAIRAGQADPLSAHGEDVVSRMERA